MRNLTEININEGGKTVSRPSPSDKDFEEFQETFGILLPENLKLLLRTANGGHPELDSVSGIGGQYAINRFYHLYSDDKGPESLWYSMAHWRQILGNRAIPFANDGGGNQFFLDLSDEPPSVKLCLHDKGMRCVLIAPSFEDLIDELHVDPDMI